MKSSAVGDGDQVDVAGGIRVEVPELDIMLALHAQGGEADLVLRLIRQVSNWNTRRSPGNVAQLSDERARDALGGLAR